MNKCWRIFFDVKKMKYYLFLHANGNVIKYEICRVMYEELKNMFEKKKAKMTSKEALNDLRERIIHPEYFEKNEMLNELTIIKKDLDILELLKSKHVDIAELKEDDNVKIYNMSMMQQDRLFEEEFKMLKEWLENDK